MQKYLNLLRDIKTYGTHKPAARENMPGTQSLFGYQFRHRLSDGFPLLTTKHISFKNIVVELLWFLRGDTNIKYLIDNSLNIWNQDAYNYYLKKLKEHVENPIPFSFEEFVNIIKNNTLDKLSFNSSIPNYKLGDCGFQYGKVWREWNGKPYCVNFEHEIDCSKVDQIKNLIDGLKNNPEGRRHIVTAIDPAHDTDLALYWCHAMFQMNCRPMTRDEREDYLANVMGEGYPATKRIDEELERFNVPKYYLDCQLYQRSCDVFLGVPYNIASYALLTHIVAKICNMVPGDYIHTFGDVHIYDNHKEAVEEQLKREPTSLPQLLMSDKFHYSVDSISPDTDLQKLIEQWDYDDFKLDGYNPQPAIKAELSTGLKK